MRVLGLSAGKNRGKRRLRQSFNFWKLLPYHRDWKELKNKHLFFSGNFLSRKSEQFLDTNMQTAKYILGKLQKLQRFMKLHDDGQK